MRRIGCVLACGAWPLWGCASPVSSIDESDQQYVFEVEYVNFAWGLTWVGIVIDRDGVIRAYDHSHEAWQPASDVFFTGEELAAKYASQGRVVGSLDVDEVWQQVGRVAGVGEEFREPEARCADTGGLVYAAFRFDDATDRYARVVLREEGDRPRANTSSRAEAVASWLRDLLGDLQIAGLAPLTVCLP